MKNPSNYLLYLGASCLLLALLSACAMSDLIGSGNVITEERTIDGFDEIDFEFVGTLNLTQGDQTSLTIQGDDNVVERIETTVRGNTLTIKAKNRRSFINIRPSTELIYTVTTPTLEKLNLFGAGSVYADGFTTTDLTIDVSGAGSLDFSQLNTGDLNIEVSGAASLDFIQLNTADLNIDMSGAGSIDLSGVAQTLDVQLDGLGSLDAADLVSDSAEIDISGAGSAELWVRESLEAEINGAGSIAYYGEPTVVQDVSGVGSIDSLGSRE